MTLRDQRLAVGAREVRYALSARQMENRWLLFQILALADDPAWYSGA